MITESKKQMQAIMQIDAKLDEISELLGQVAMSKDDAHDMQDMLYQFYAKLEEVTIWP
jgi:ribosome assembly protein YihI (activator of Der GTPase)